MSGVDLTSYSTAQLHMWLKDGVYGVSGGTFNGAAGGSGVPISLQLEGAGARGVGMGAGTGSGMASAGARPGLLSRLADGLLPSTGVGWPGAEGGAAGVLSMMSGSLP